MEVAGGVPNGSPGPNASGYGNGGAGGHSCQILAVDTMVVDQEAVVLS